MTDLERATGGNCRKWQLWEAVLDGKHRNSRGGPVKHRQAVGD